MVAIAYHKENGVGVFNPEGLLAISIEQGGVNNGIHVTYNRGDSVQTEIIPLDGVVKIEVILDAHTGPKPSGIIVPTGPAI